MNEKVLLLDDEADFVEAMAERMHARGMDVKVTTSPEEALKMAGEESFDAVVMDLIMPEVDGLEVLKELKERNPGLRVIILTGYATSGKRKEAKELGAMDLLEKPADIHALILKIRGSHKTKEGLSRT